MDIKIKGQISFETLNLFLFNIKLVERLRIGDNEEFNVLHGCVWVVLYGDLCSRILFGLI